METDEALARRLQQEVRRIRVCIHAAEVGVLFSRQIFFHQKLFVIFTVDTVYIFIVIIYFVIFFL